MIIQFLLSLVLLASLVMTWRRAKQTAIRRSEAVLWSVIWIVAFFVIWQPNITTKIANLVGIGRGADLIIYGSVIILFVMIFQLHVAHDKLERTLTDVVRRDALRKMQGERKEDLARKP